MVPTPDTVKVPAYRKTIDNVSIDEFERVLRQACDHTGKNEAEVMQLIGLTPSAIHGMRSKKRCRRVTFLALKGVAANGGSPSLEESALSFEECAAVIRSLRHVKPASTLIRSAQTKLTSYLTTVAL
jgi:hypothetical protein